jgi:hemerythrin-like domain-containing protein
MAHIHNAVLRGYNSIYLQAPYVKDGDKSAFIGYALTWFRFVKSHHDDEEMELFPKVEEQLGNKNIWKETHEEHSTICYILRDQIRSDRVQKAFWTVWLHMKHTSPHFPRLTTLMAINLLI